MVKYTPYSLIVSPRAVFSLLPAVVVLGWPVVSGAVVSVLSDGASVDGAVVSYEEAVSSEAATVDDLLLPVFPPTA